MTFSNAFVRGVSVAVALWSIGCASHRTPRPSADAQARDSLETFIGKTRRLSISARPAKSVAATLESSDPALHEALQALAGGATALTQRRVADAYRRAGVLDTAYRHYTAAILLDGRDPASYDGLARVWRDMGTPALGVGDARRAIFYAPRSAEAYNTFGTLLYALGQRPEARQAFERALELDPEAAYAWTNLCYSSFQDADTVSALASCRRAIALDPGQATAHNDLGLVYAAQGDLASAATEFSVAGGDLAREYNLGIVLSAGRQYAEAAKAFEAAQTLRPGWKSATDRVRQSRRLAQQTAPPPLDVPLSHVSP